MPGFWDPLLNGVGVLLSVGLLGLICWPGLGAPIFVPIFVPNDDLSLFPPIPTPLLFLSSPCLPVWSGPLIQSIQSPITFSNYAVCISAYKNELK